MTLLFVVPHDTALVWFVSLMALSLLTSTSLTCSLMHNVLMSCVCLSCQSITSKACMLSSFVVTFLKHSPQADMRRQYLHLRLTWSVQGEPGWACKQSPSRA